ncbi:T9SS type B sorting domain-containing protein, partial [Tenacibaculum sp. 190524A05c]
SITTNQFTNLPPNTYTVTATGSNGCVTVGTPVTITELAPITFTVAPVVTEFGCTTGNVTDAAMVTVDTANLSGGSGTYVRVVFTYTPAVGTVETQDSTTFSFGTTNTSGGTVSIDVYDDEGCMATTNATIAPFNAITDAVITVDKAIDCATGEDITVTYTSVSPITADFTISGANTGFNAANTTGVFTGLAEDVYTITITNPTTGCVITESHQVNAEPTFNLDVSLDSNVVCLGDSNGSMTFDFATSSPYTGTYDYEVFQSGGTSTGITGTGVTGATTVNTLGAGTYYVQVTMTASPFCPVVSPEVTISEPASPLTIGYTTNLISCISPTSGEVVINGSGGWSSYEYQLENTTTATTVQSFSNNNIITGLASGTYLVSVRDANGCIATDTFTLSDPTTITATIVETTSIACEGDETAEISVNAVSGGQGNPAVYSYSLTFPNGDVSAIQPGNTFTGLGAGSYTVTVYDEFSCSNTFPVIITEPSDVTASAVVTSIITCTSPNATIEVTGAGGTGVYEYSIDGMNFVASNTFAVPAGDYELFVRDANGCISIPSIVSVPALVPLTATLNTGSAFITCNGDANAILSATAAGGLGNYMYELLESGTVVAGPQSSDTFDSIGPGTYSIRVTSQDCIVETGTFEIVDPPLLEVTETHVDVSCNGSTDGSITINATGGTGSYVYEIDTDPGRFQTSNEFNNLPAGTYVVTTQDERGCFEIVTVTIEEPPILEATIDVTTVQQQLCVQDTAPSFEVAITGGTPPYSTSLNGGAFIDDRIVFDNLTAGETYVVIVRDSRGCTTVTSPFTFDPAVDLQFNSEITYNCDGTITITGTVADIHENDVVYTLTGPESSSNDTGVFNVTATGTYTLEVEHVNGCTRVITPVEVEVIAPLQITIDDSQINMLIANATGGIPPYEYSIDGSDFSFENQFVITQTRDYTIVVRDSRGCEQSITVEGVYITIEVPNIFTPDGDGIQDYWYPINVQDYHQLKVVIFDRYGREISKYNGIQVGWDGLYQGRPMPSGDYWYTIEFVELSGEQRRLMGHFTLYR